MPGKKRAAVNASYPDYESLNSFEVIVVESFVVRFTVYMYNLMIKIYYLMRLEEEEMGSKRAQDDG